MSCEVLNLLSYCFVNPLIMYTGSFTISCTTELESFERLYDYSVVSEVEHNRTNALEGEAGRRWTSEGIVKKIKHHTLLI